MKLDPSTDKSRSRWSKFKRAENSCRERSKGNRESRRRLRSRIPLVNGTEQRLMIETLGVFSAECGTSSGDRLSPVQDEGTKYLSLRERASLLSQFVTGSLSVASPCLLMRIGDTSHDTLTFHRNASFTAYMCQPTFSLLAEWPAADFA